MLDVLLDTAPWTVPLLALLLFGLFRLRRWWIGQMEGLQRTQQYLRNTLPKAKEPFPDTYLAPEVYATPTFKVPELMGLAKNKDYPQRSTALGYVGQYFSKDYAKKDRRFEKDILELVADPAVAGSALSVLKGYCERFGKPSLQKKAEKLKEEAEANAQAEAKARRPQEVLLLLGTAVTEGNAVEVAGRKMTSIEDCYMAVQAAQVGEEVEVAIGSGKKMKREKMIFHLP